MLVHVVTFEGVSSGGFNWYYKAEDADRNYHEELIIYQDSLFFCERHVISRFDIEIPSCFLSIEDEKLRQQGITNYLSENDIYKHSDSAERRVIVG